MKSSPDIAAPVAIPQATAGILERRLRTGYFVLEALNGLSTGYYFNYLFFYLQEHFGFGNHSNLLMAAIYGFIYMFAAWYAGLFAQKRGYFFSLTLGFAGMAMTMVAGALLPRFYGYTHAALVGNVIVMIVWTFVLCFTWPTLQSLLSQRQSPGQNSRTAGIYNMIWAGASAGAYLTSGVLLEKFGGETLFWLPAGMHLIQLAMLPYLKKLNGVVTATDTVPGTAEDELPPLNPRPIAKARTFVFLARLANPFAYVGIYGVLPVIPQLSEHFGLSPAMAGLVCSVWFWSRLVAFIWFWLWPGWHYRFDWLLGAFVGLIGSFVAVLLSTQIWMLIIAQIIFGLAIGLIYYSSLFYSMDAGEAKGKNGGLHEAAIGLGVFIGPVTGVAALHFFPAQPHAGTWGIAALLVVGLLLFVAVRLREIRPSPTPVDNARQW